MTPVATDPLIAIFKEQKFLAGKPVTLVWQQFTKLGVSFLVCLGEGHNV